MKRIIVALVAILVWSRDVNADLILSTVASAHTIDFDTTVAHVNNGPFSGTGFQPSPLLGQLDSDSWAIAGFSDGTLVFGGTQTTPGTDFTRGTAVHVPVGTGGLYAMSGGNISTGSTLGFQPTEPDWTPGTLTLRLRNETGVTIGTLNLSYIVYVRNDESRSSQFHFSHSANDSAYLAVPALNLVSPAAPDAFGFVPHARSASLTGLNIAHGSNYFFRWSGADVSGSGLRDEFALDNISVMPLATSVPEPASFSLCMIALIGCGLRRIMKRLRGANIK